MNSDSKCVCVCEIRYNFNIIQKEPDGDSYIYWLTLKFVAMIPVMLL